MPNRLDLHERLCEVLGSRNVYFQPPESVKLVYPAIVYELSKINNRYANDGVYIQADSYTVTFISKNPDSEIIRTLSKLPTCRFDRGFVSNNLYHKVFTLYY